MWENSEQKTGCNPQNQSVIRNFLEQIEIQLLMPKESINCLKCPEQHITDKYSKFVAKAFFFFFFMSFFFRHFKVLLIKSRIQIN